LPADVLAGLPSGEEGGTEPASRPAEPAPADAPPAQDVTAAAPPAAWPYAFLDKCRAVATEPGYFSNAGPGSYEGRAEGDRYTPREDFAALDGWYKKMSGKLGRNFVVVLVPEDQSKDSVAFALNETHGVGFEFARLNVGRVARSALEAREKDA